MSAQSPHLFFKQGVGTAVAANGGSFQRKQWAVQVNETTHLKHSMENCKIAIALSLLQAFFYETALSSAVAGRPATSAKPIQACSCAS